MGISRGRRNVVPLETLEGRVLFATFTWDGGGGNANWQTAANWTGDVAPGGTGTDALVFPSGAARLTNANNFAAGTDFASITFTGGGYTVSGNALDLGATGIASSGGANEIQLNLTLLANASIGVSDASTLTVSGNIDNATRTLTVNPSNASANVNFTGVISNSGGLTKNGVGVARFSGASTYSGSTTLSAGTTVVANSSGSAFGSGNVSNTGGTLRGNGSFTGALANNIALSPGLTAGATGVIGTGNLTFGASGNLSLNVNGTAAGTGFDQINVTGTVDLDNGHQLIASTSSYTPVGGERLFIIVNDGVDAVQGAFAGLEDPDNDTIEINGEDYNISYTGDSATNDITGGNDVVLFIGGVNQSPVNSVPGTQTTNEDSSKTFSASNGNAITISDPDAGLAEVQTQLSVNNGAALALQTTNLITAGGNGTSTVTIKGTISAINAALDGLVVTPAANSTSPVTLSILTNDLGNGTGVNPKTDSDSVTINITAVNDAPTVSVPSGGQTTPENVAKVFSSANGNAFTVADIDAGSNPVRVTLNASNGIVTLNGSSGITVNSGASGTSTVTFSGTVSAVNGVMNGMSFTPATDSLATGALDVSVSDQGNTGTGGPLTASAGVSITVLPAGSLALSSATYSVSEDVGAGVATITVVRAGGSAGQATIQYATSNGTATAGSDYTAASGTLTFADGQTSKTFNIPITDDSLDEDDETVSVALSGVTGARAGTPLAGTLTIADNDAPPSITIGDVSFAEGNSGTTTANFTVALSAASGRTITVNYSTADGTATAGSDYVATSGTLTFTPGQTSKTISVTINGDVTQENVESFTVNLGDANNATIADDSATGLIIDDDAAGPTLAFAQDVTVNEGNSGTTNATFTVFLISGDGSSVTVNYATAGGSATSGVDFVPTTGVLTFSPGQTSKTINVPVYGDTINEDSELFTLDLSNSTNAVILDGTAVATIFDNDPAPGISIADATGVEGTGSPAGTVDFTVSLSAVSGKTVTASYSTADIDAVGTNDYAPATGTITFAPGETSKVISVATIGDSIDELDETFHLSLTSVANATVSDGQAVGTITDDDAPPSISINDVTTSEPLHPGTKIVDFVVSLSGPSGLPVTVDFSTQPITALEGVDYLQSSGTLTFSPGETTKAVSVVIKSDTELESDESFKVVLGDAGTSTIDKGEGAGTITDTPPNATPTAGGDAFTLAAGQAYADLDVLNNDADADNDTLTTSIASNPVNGTASANSDQTIRYTPNVGYSGADSFTYTVSDGRGGSATASVSLTVTGNGVFVNPTNPKKMDLFLAAGSGDDQIQLIKVGKKIRYVVNGQEQGMFAANGNIVISGGAGNDALILKKIAQPILFNGGEGDDIVVGGSKGNILIGGPGNDNLVGGGGRDILIGGDGADSISTLGGSDILISGSTIYDADTIANRAALNDLLTELASKRKYADKLARFTSSAGVGGSGARLTVNETVFDDADVDTLNSGGSQDFYVADTNSVASDVIIKLAKNESIIEL